MNTPQQIIRRAQKRTKQKTGPLEGASSVSISASNAETGEVQVTGAIDPRMVAPNHPAEGQYSWMRWQPDNTGGAIVSYRTDGTDNSAPEIMRYTTTKEYRRTRLANYRLKTDYYRVLQPGEFELSSKGLSQSYWGQRPHHDTRAGSVRSWEDGDILEIGAKAPTHTRVLHKNQSTAIGDEERFGVVKRPVSAIKYKYGKYRGKFAKEYLMNLLDGDGKPLVDIRLGHVFDDTGSPATMSSSGKSLRVQHRYYNTSGSTTSFEVDENGNVALTLPTTANKGININAPATTGMLSIKVAGNLTLTADTTQVSIKDKLGNEILFCSTGMFFFDSLKNSTSLANLIWHTHTTPVGPTSPASASPVLVGPGAILPFTPIAMP